MLELDQIIVFNSLKNARGYPLTGKILEYDKEANVYQIVAFGLYGPGSDTLIKDVPPEEIRLA